jgi:hypothetical protein
LHKAGVERQSGLTSKGIFRQIFDHQDFRAQYIIHMSAAFVIVMNQKCNIKDTGESTSSSSQAKSGNHFMHYLIFNLVILVMRFPKIKSTQFIWLQ